MEPITGFRKRLTPTSRGKEDEDPDQYATAPVSPWLVAFSTPALGVLARAAMRLDSMGSTTRRKLSARHWCASGQGMHLRHSARIAVQWRAASCLFPPSVARGPRSFCRFRARCAREQSFHLHELGPKVLEQGASRHDARHARGVPRREVRDDLGQPRVSWPQND